MIVDVGLLVIVGALVAAGVFLIMERSILRMLLGMLLAGNGVNLLILLAGGGSGDPPIVGADGVVYDTDADPLVQAMILTAIVISMGMTAFVMSLAYRAFTATKRHEEIGDDPEDTQVTRRTESEGPARDRTSDERTGRITSAGDRFGPENASEGP